MLRFETAGESHGECLVATVTGLPAGVPVSLEKVNHELWRRQQIAVRLSQGRSAVYVNHYYFYIDDADFGPLFLKVCSYAPWAIKLCLSGHEWAKRQLDQEGIGYEALDNGFLWCADRLQHRHRYRRTRIVPSNATSTKVRV